MFCHNVTMRRVHETTVAVESNMCSIVCVCVCACVSVRRCMGPRACVNGSVCVWPYLSSMQSACAVLYCHLWPLWLHHIFRRYLVNGTIFGGGNTEHKMCVLIFSTTFIWNISRFRKNLSKYFHNYENVFMWSTPYPCRILMKLGFSRHNFQKKF